MSVLIQITEMEGGRWVYKVDNVFQPFHPEKDGDVPMTEQEARFYARQVAIRMDPTLEIEKLPEVELPVRSIKTSTFLQRLGLDKIGVIVARAPTEPELAALVLLVQTAGEVVDLDNAEVQAGMQILLQKGILNMSDVQRIIS